MKNVEAFYKETEKFNKPSSLLKNFFLMNFDKDLKEKIAIDLGSGAGNDALFLIDKGFKVTCVDKEDKSKEYIINRVKNDNKINFLIENFENVKLHKADFIYSCFSLHFCTPTKFDNIMNEIRKNIIPGGFFAGNFLGIEDEWNNNKDMTFVSKEQILDYFKDFDILYYAEKKYIKEVAVTGKKKFWHVFELYAKKK